MPRRPQEVAEHIDYWRPKLLLDHHALTPKFHRRPRSQDETEDEVSYALTEYGGIGFEATINIYPEFWKHDSDRRKKNILHELLHVAAQSASESDIIALTEIIWRIDRAGLLQAEMITEAGRGSTVRRDAVCRWATGGTTDDCYGSGGKA